MKWKVEHRFAHGWDDAGWNDTFGTRAEAVAAIDEFIADTATAHAAGYLADAYRRRDYRAAKAEGET